MSAETIAIKLAVWWIIGKAVLTVLGVLLFILAIFAEIQKGKDNK